MKIYRIMIPFFLLVMFVSCDKDEEIDQEKPVIDLSIQDAFPLNCDTLYFGESFKFKVLFMDNFELGSYSIDIHNNFDHHSHSTEVTECDFDPDKDPVHPFLFVEDYEIPAGLKEFETDLSIAIPAGDENVEYDEGDYHLFISLTDKEGWSAKKGLNIKMLYK